MEFFKKGERDAGSEVEEGKGPMRQKVGQNVEEGIGCEVRVQAAEKIPRAIIVPKRSFIFDDGAIHESSTNSGGIELKIENMVKCPVCGEKVLEAGVNEHVDLCLWMVKR